MKVIKQYIWLIKGIWKKGKYILCLYIAICLFGSIVPTLVSYSQRVFVSELENSTSFSVVLLCLSTYVCIKFIRSVYQYVDSFFAHKFIYRTNLVFNEFLTKALYKERQQSFYDSSFNDQLNCVVRGYGVIPFQIFAINEIIILLFVVVFVQIPLILNVSPYLLIIIIIDPIFSLFIARKFAREGYEMELAVTREQRKENYYGNIFSSKAHSRDIRVFGAQNFFLEKWSGQYNYLCKTRNAFESKKQHWQTVSSLLGFLVDSTLLVFLFYELYNKHINIGTFIFLYNIIPATSSQVKTLLQSSFGDIYTNYLNIENYINYVAKTKSESVTPLLRENMEFEKLEMNNVSYKYPSGQDHAVKNISFGIKKGEIVSILGYNGSGKTTLVKLITGVLSPTQGDIYLNRKNIQDIPKESVSALYGIAYQEFTRYLLTVRDNVGFGFIEKDSEENIKKALREADMKLPVTLDTKIGKELYSDGIDLSGGQWQKIDLARAYMGGHCVLVLDEPTASVDPFKEIEMLSHFRTILQGRTAILISHRIGFARLCDRIVMMDKGEIVESGTHDELLNKNGFYSELFNAQKELYQ